MKKILSLAFLATIPACGSTPALTQTSTATSVEHSTEGGEVRRSTTETSEVAQDGASTTERTETTSTTTPPPSR